MRIINGLDVDDKCTNCPQPHTHEMSVAQSSSLPDFGQPPIMEVAIGFQFAPIEFDLVQYGLWAIAMRDRGYIRIEKHPPLSPIMERFGIPAKADAIELSFGLPDMRYWFVTRDNNHIIQLQSDRLILNWRRFSSPAVEYPRYDSIRAEFSTISRALEMFVNDECRADLVPNQAEVTYINHIYPSNDSASLGDITPLAGKIEQPQFLPQPKDNRVGAGYTILHSSKPIGRLHVSAATAVDLQRQSPMVVLSLTARGQPIGDGIDGVLSFTDLGHEWIVRGFSDVTTQSMHREWMRTR